MTRRSKSVVQALMVSLTYGCSRSSAQANFERQASELLLQRFETVVSARTNVLTRLDFDHPEQDFGRKYLGVPFVYLMGGLKLIGPNTLHVVEAGSSTVLTGSKDFVAPERNGMVSSRMCYIAILGSEAAPNITREFSKVKVESIDARTVWTWSASPQQGFTTEVRFYAAVVAGSFFVLANDRDDFRETADTLARGAKGNARVNAVMDRDLASVRANPYWAYRGIRRTEGADAAASGLTRLPASAVRLRLFTKFDDGKLFFDVVVTDDGSGSAPPKGLPSSELMSFQRAGSGVWQATIPLTTSQTTNALFQVMGFLGYGLVM